jgi:DNA invertase Pin-like site-specific DNA recombinase
MSAIPTNVPRAVSGLIPVAIYTRVSTTDQVGGRFDSCASQEHLAREHIKKNADKGWYLSEVFSDPAYSGGSMKRPGMQALMRHIETGGAKAVLIFKFERVLRNTDEWTPFRAFLKKHKCRLESPIEDLADETPIQRFNNNMRANLSEYERLNTAEKVRIKMLEQAKQGIWNAGQVPYGYNYDREAQLLTPNKVEADVVRRIFESAARLVSLTEIANCLNSEGLRTKVRIFQRRDGRREEVGGRRFRSDKLRKIIESPIYRGRVRLNGEEFSGKHDPLVSKELWERANAAATLARKSPPYRQQTRDKHGHLLKGLIFCGSCKRAMIPDFGGKRNRAGQLYRYYTCGAFHKERTDSNCPVGRLPADALENAAFGLMAAIGRREEIVKSSLLGAKEFADTKRPEVRQRIADLDRNLKRISIRISNCIEAISVGGLEPVTDEIREQVMKLKTQKDRALVERERLRQELARQEIGNLNASRLAKALSHFDELIRQLDPEEQRTLVALCVDRIEIRRKSPRQSQQINNRVIDIRLRLHAAELVAGMEEQVVVQTRGNGTDPDLQKSICLHGKIDLGKKPGRIMSPVSEELPSAALKPESRRERPPKHPLHRAVAWKQKLRANPQLSHAALAQREALSEATVSRMLKLLRLQPEIQEVLLAIKKKEDLRRYSLNKMVEVAALPSSKQRRAFARLSA